MSTTPPSTGTSTLQPANSGSLSRRWNGMQSDVFGSSNANNADKHGSSSSSTPNQAHLRRRQWHRHQRSRCRHNRSSSSSSKWVALEGAQRSLHLHRRHPRQRPLMLHRHRRHRSKHRSPRQHHQHRQQEIPTQPSPRRTFSTFLAR